MKLEHNITYRQKDKGWQIIVSYKDNFGNWKQKSKQGFKNKKDAKSYADNIVNKLKQNFNLDTDYADLTFKEFVDIYLEYVKIHMEYNTYDLYKYSLNKFTDFNNLKMIDITPLQIQMHIDKMIEENKYMFRTICTIKDKVTAMFNAAANQFNVIPKSPATKIKIKIEKKTNKKIALTQSELKDLLNKTQNQKYKVIFTLAGMCGMRFGEISGLTWNNINLKDRVITVEKQWKRIDNGIWGYGELKTKNSYRQIPLTPYVETILKDFSCSHPIDISNRVIVYKTLSGIDKLLRNYCKKLGYDISIHEFRHTYATTLISNGVDFKTTAQLMGHDIKQTMQTYSHVTDDMIENATKVLSNIF
jgi:integrase